MTVDNSDLQSLQGIIAGVHMQEEEQTDGSTNERHAAQSVATIVDNVNASTFDENVAVANDKGDQRVGGKRSSVRWRDILNFCCLRTSLSLSSVRSTSCAASRWQVALKQVGRNARHSTSTSATAVGRRNPLYLSAPTSSTAATIRPTVSLVLCTSTSTTVRSSLSPVAHAAGTISDSEAFESNQESKPAQQRFVYDQDGCDNSYTLKSNLTKHIKDTHDWVQKKCDKAGCTGETEFETGGGV
jgi:hypothetical protein